MNLSPLAFIRAHPGTVAGWFQQGASATAAVLCVPLIIRYLGNEKTGVWLGFQSLAAVATLADFGFGYVTARQVAFSLGQKGDSKAGPDIDPSQMGWQGVVNTLAMTRRLNFWSCMVGFVLMGAVGVYVAGNPRFQIIPQNELLTTWILLSASLVFTMMGKPDYAVLEGAGYLPSSRLISGTQILVGAVATAVCAILGGGLLYMALVSAVVTAGGTCWLHLHARYALSKGAHLKSSYSNAQLRKMIRVALPMGAVNLGSYLFSSIQVPMIAALLSPALVAPFYLAQRCGQFLNVAVLQFLFPKLPQFSILVSQGRSQDARHLMHTTLRVVFSVSLGVSLVFVFLVPFVCEQVLNVRMPSHLVLTLMAVDYLVLNCTVGWGHFVLAAGRNPFLVSTLVTGVVNLSILYLFLGEYGVIAIPAATVISGLLCSYWVCLLAGFRLDSRLSTS